MCVFVMSWQAHCKGHQYVDEGLVRLDGRQCIVPSLPSLPSECGTISILVCSPLTSFLFLA